MNILLLSGLYDTQPASGGSYLMREFVQELKGQGHNVYLYYLTSADSDPRKATIEPNTWYLPDLRDALAASRPFYLKLWYRLSSILMRVGFGRKGLERYFFRDFGWLSNLLKAAIRDYDIDIVQVDFPWMMNVARVLPKDTPKVFVSHEAKFVLLNREQQIAQSNESKNYETTLGRGYHAILTLTDIEAEEWKVAGVGTKVFNSPMGVKLPKEKKEVASKAEKLVFLGSGNHQPNLDGIRYFLLEIWPIVHSMLPQICIEITGKYKYSFVEEFKTVENVVWVGFVPNLANLMHGAISVVPIRKGSGIRVKILESMALGAAVVSTTMAAEGIMANNNEEIILVNDPVTFANSIVMLCENDAQFQAVAKAGCEFVYEQFEVGNCTKKRVELLQRIVTYVKH